MNVIRIIFFGIADRMRWLFSPQRLFGRLCRMILPIEFLAEWFNSRNYKQLVLGLPALLGLLALTAGGVYAFLPKEPESLNHYLDQSIAARNNGETEIADLFMRKAAAAKTDSPAARFKQAVLLGQESDVAREIIQELSPPNAKGHVPARAWMLNALNAQLVDNLKNKNPTEADLELRARIYEQMEAQAQRIATEVPAEEINYVRELRPGSRASYRALALEKLALIRLDNGDGEKALEYLAELVRLNPQANLLYSKLLAAKGEQVEADKAVQRAIDYHQTQLQKADLPLERQRSHKIQVASGIALQGNFEDAATALLVDGKYPTDAASQSALGDIFYVWSESIEVNGDLTTDDNSEQLAEKLKLLNEAWRLRPQDPRVLLRIATIAGIEGESGEKAKQSMKRVLAAGNAPAVVHFVLGVNELQAGNIDKSLAHIELANKVGPNAPITLNNLAYLLSQQDPPELDRALTLIDQAIKANPKVPEFYDTRGVIYIKLERWIDAIADLERALRAGVKNEVILHQSLSKAYSEIGDADLAKMHADKAAQAIADERSAARDESP